MDTPGRQQGSMAGRLGTVDHETARSETAPETQKPLTVSGKGFLNYSFDIVTRSYVFGRPCSDLLSQALRLSTIGAEEFDGRVRDGIGSWAPRKNHKVSEKRMSEFWLCYSDIAFPCKKQCLVYF